MGRLLRFLLPLLLVLGLLAWGAAGALNAISREWTERDIDLRAQAVLNGAKEGLSQRWREGDWNRLARILRGIERDKRIMAVEACSLDLQVVAGTAPFPKEFDCTGVGPRVVRAAPGGIPALEAWNERGVWGEIPVHLNALPIADEEGPLGFVILIHDMSFARQREEVTRRATLGAFALLALAASIATVLVRRISWRGWTEEIRHLLRDGSHRREFQPLVRDIRDLISRIATESGLGGAWTPHRLRETLRQNLGGERVLIVANREPYQHERTPDAILKVSRPSSGLVSALEPVLQACSGVWIAHGSGSGDRLAVDRRDHVRVPPGEESYDLRRVWLTEAEEKGYYYGFANEGLWPLCHLAHARPVFRAEDWAEYRRVNEKFADAVVSEVETPDPIIFIQDYHFALLPRLLRERLPGATLLAFWHIPWPNSERLGICPWTAEILQGLLGSSILGFHTQYHCNNFLDGIDRFLEARLDRDAQGVVLGGQMTLVRPYPISVEWPERWTRELPPPSECRRCVLEERGLPPDTLLGVGVDRMDYTKGIEDRFLAIERLLERSPRFRGRFTFVELAAPSRSVIDRYRETRRQVEEAAARVNERFGGGGYRPIVLDVANHQPPAVFRHYRAADLCYVSSLHDGMNLVAKEFVAARDDERGVLVLSRFTGAARELTDALLVNPYDLEESSSALEAALTMDPSEQETRMRSMRRLVAEYNVYRWAGRILLDAARLRQRERPRSVGGRDPRLAPPPA